MAVSLVKWLTQNCHILLSQWAVCWLAPRTQRLQPRRRDGDQDTADIAHRQTSLQRDNTSSFTTHRPHKDDTTVHLIAQGSALMLLLKEILGDSTLSLDMLSDIYRLFLLRFAKKLQRGSIDLEVCQGCELGPCCGLSTGCLPSAGIRPTGKVR